VLSLVIVNDLVSVCQKLAPSLEQIQIVQGHGLEH
jgi:hypothetical protein